LLCHFSYVMTRLPPCSTLFPYTTLFRSSDDRGHGVGPGVVEPLDEEVSVVDTPADVDVSSVDVLRLGVGGRGAAGLDLEYFSPPLGGSDDVGGEAPLGVQGQSQVHLLAARHV